LAGFHGGFMFLATGFLGFSVLLGRFWGSFEWFLLGLEAIT